jgi:hypothetical protein
VRLGDSASEGAGEVVEVVVRDLLDEKAAPEV